MLVSYISKMFRSRLIVVLVSSMFLWSCATPPSQDGVSSETMDAYNEFAKTQPNFVFENEETLLTRLIDANNLKKVRVLLDAGADPNLASYFGPPLLHAMLQEEQELTRFLRDSGATLDGANQVQKLNALCELVKHPELAQRHLNSLLVDELDLNVKCPDGLPPLFHALQNKDIASRLIEQGANINAAIILDHHTVLSYAIEEADIELMKLAIAANADLQALTADGRSPLEVSFDQTSIAARELLAENGVTVADWDSHKRNEVYCAVVEEANLAEAHASYLADLGIESTSACPDSGESVLFKLLSKPSLMKELISKRVSIDVLSQQGDSLLALAVRNDELETFNLLFDSGAKGDALSVGDLVSLYQQIELADVERLLEAGVEKQVHQQASNELLCLALAETPISDALVDKAFAVGASADADCKEGELSVAALFLVLENSEYLDRFIQQGANVNIKNPDGESPLVIVLKKRNTAAIEKLLDAGSHAAELKLDQVTRLYYEGHYVSIVEKFLSAGMDPIVHERGVELAVCYALSSKNAVAKYYQDTVRLKGFSKAKCQTQQNVGNFVNEPALFAAIRMQLDISAFIDDGFPLDSLVNNETALSVAISSRNLKAAEKLLLSGARAQGLSVGHVQYLYASKNIEFIELLKKSGLPSHVQQTAADVELCKALRGKQNEGLVAALAMGGDPNAKCWTNNGKKTYGIFLALQNGLSVEDLLAVGALPNVEDESGLTPLIIALTNKDTPLVKQLAEYGARAESLAYDSVKYLYLSNDKLTLLRLKQVGLNEKFDDYAAVLAEYENECDKLPEEDVNDFAYTQVYYKPLEEFGDDPFVSRFFLEKYRNCLEKIFYSTKNHRDLLLYQPIAAEPPRLSEGVLHPALIKSLLASSYLSPINQRDQQPSKAIALMNESYYEISSAMDQAQYKLNRYIEDELAKLNAEIVNVKQQTEQEVINLSGESEINKIRVWFEDILLASDVGRLNSELSGLQNHQAIYDVVKKYGATVGRLEQKKSLLASNRTELKIDVNSKRLIPPQTDLYQSWEENGIRLTLPRFSDTTTTLDARNGMLDHTRFLVRLVTDKGVCTGAIIGPGVILTAQRCVMKQGEMINRLTVSWDHIAVDNRGLVRKALNTQGDWKVKTSLGNHEESWKNDWAVLSLQIEKKQLPIWFKSGMNLVSKSDFAKVAEDYQNVDISLAGYSSEFENQYYLTMDWGCDIAFRPSSLLAQHCKGWKGDGGAPYIVSSGPAKGKIIGVHAFTFNGNGPDELSSKYSGGGATVKEILSQVNAGSVREYTVSSLQE